MTFLNRFRGARVAFLHDVFRFSVNEQAIVNLQERNIGWLQALLGGPEALGRLRISACFPALPSDAKGLARQFSNPPLWQRYLLEPELAWASVFDAEALPALSEALEPLLGCDLVVGFELPPVLRRFLHCKGAAYANFSVHPIRFLRDLCLGATTNDAAVAERLRECRLDPSEIEAQANRFRARYRRHPHPVLDLAPSVPVLVGQTERDASLIRDARFVDWPDFDLGSLLAADDAVVFLEHPYRPDSTDVVEHLRCDLGKHVLCTASGGYPLLFSLPEKRRFVTLSSSLGVEAAALGHDVHFLLGDPRERALVGGVDLPEHFMLGHRVLAQGEGSAEQAFSLGESYLRNSLEAWSYESLVRSDSAAPVHWTFLPATAQGRAGRVLPRLAADPEESQVPGLVCDGPPAGPGVPRHWKPADTAFARILRSGFYAPEDWGVWSRETSASLRLPVRPSIVEIVLDVQVFDGVAGRAPVLALHAEGELRALVFFREKAPRTRHVSFRVAVRRNGLHIELQMPERASPLECGLSSDARQLGFALLGVRAAVVTAGTAHPVAPEPVLSGIEPELLPTEAND